MIEGGGRRALLRGRANITLGMDCCSTLTAALSRSRWTEEEEEEEAIGFCYRPVRLLFHAWSRSSQTPSSSTPSMCGRTAPSMWGLAALKLEPWCSDRLNARLGQTGSSRLPSAV